MKFVVFLLALCLRAGTKVDSIGITVSDLDKAVGFYTEVLQFEKVAEREYAGQPHEHFHGVFGLRARTARLRLGAESIELTEYLAPQGRPMPEGTRGNDRWFQHIAIITSDMDRAYAHLRAHKIRHASTGPQTLPDWNPNAGGIKAFYFRDLDGHHLEILEFPKGKGLPKWQVKGKLFLGIDHTAITVADTGRSLAFYRDMLGLTVAGASENHGPEQERLNNVFGARLRITALRGDDGPGVELLEYLAPQTGRAFPPDAQPNDLLHYHTRFIATDAAQTANSLRNARAAHISPGLMEHPDFQRALAARDPDGHAVQVVERVNP